MVCSPNCTIIPPRKSQPCGNDVRPGGISYLIFLACSVDTSEYTIEDLCFYAKTGLLTVSSSLVGEKPKGSFTKKPLDSCTPDRVTGIEYRVDFKDYVADDSEFTDYPFWTELMFNSHKFKFGYVSCDGLFSGFIDNWAMEVDQVIESKSTDTAFWDGSIMWNGAGLPVPVFIPNLVTTLVGCMDEFDPDSIIGIEPQCLTFGIADLDVIHANPSLSNGKITVHATGGTGYYEYNIGSGWVLNSVFTGLAVGTYTIQVRDVNIDHTEPYTQCNTSKVIEVKDGCASMYANPVSENATNSDDDGVITINAGGGTDSYQYNLDGGAWQSGNVFNSLASDTYTVGVKDLITLCEVYSPITVNKTDDTVFAAHAHKVDAGGPGRLGVITVHTDSGSGHYLYRLNGGNWVSHNSFELLTAGTYLVEVRDTQLDIIEPFTVTIDDLCAALTIVSATPTPTGDNNQGTITVLVTGGSGAYEYSSDAVTWQASPYLVNLPANIYTIYVRDVATNCSKNMTGVVVVDLCAAFQIVSAVPSGSGLEIPTGQIIVNATGGSGNYIYTIDGGNWQTSNIFTNVPVGNYAVKVRDLDNDCERVSQIIAVVNLCTNMAMSGISIQGSGNLNTGTITVGSVNGGGSGPYEYSVDGVSWQPSSTLTDLAPGIYTVYVRDSITFCTIHMSNTVVPDLCASFNIGEVVTMPSGFTPNGSLNVINVSGGSGNYEYSLDGLTYQPSPSFNNVAAGTYSIFVRDTTNGCLKVKSNVTVGNICGSLVVQSVNVAGGGLNPVGSITVTGVSGGSGNYEYSLDNSTYSGSSTIPNLYSGEYDVYVRDITSGCIATKQVDVPNVCGSFKITGASAQPGGPLANGTVTLTMATTIGSGNYEISKDGVNYFGTSTLTGFTGGTHTVYARDLITGCVDSTNVVVPDACPLLVIGQTAVLGSGPYNNGTISVIGITGGSGNYEYSVNGVVYSPSATIANVGVGTQTVYVRDTTTGCVATKSVVVGDVCPALLMGTPLVVGAGPTDEGSITVTGVTGGSGNYEYSLDTVVWQGSAVFPNLGAGNYIAYARDLDSGCVIFRNTEIPDLCALLSITSVIVNGGSGVNPIGVIVVDTVIGGSGDYSYSLDGLVFQVSDTFTALAIGTYTVYVQDNTTGCISSTQAIVPDICPLLYISNVTVTPSGIADIGTIVVSGVTGNVGNLEYSIDGTAFQANPDFDTLEVGSYVVYVRDIDSGCVASTPVTVTDMCPLLNVGSVVTEGSGIEDVGTITVGSAYGGTGNYEYSLDGVAFVPPALPMATFIDLEVGTYTVYVRDTTSLCVASKEVEVIDVCPLLTIGNITTVGSGVEDVGQVTVVSVTGGAGNYEYSLDGGAFVAGNTFTDVQIGTHTVAVRDIYTGCVATKTCTVLDICPLLTLGSITTVGSGVEDIGSITITAVTGGSNDYTYSIDGGAYGILQTFTLVSVGDHTIAVRDEVTGCVTTRVVNVPDICPLLTMGTVFTKGSGVTDVGVLTVTAVTGGSDQYEYAIDGGAWQANETFNNVAVGDHSIAVRDTVSLCTVTREVTVVDVCPLLTIGTIATVGSGVLPTGKITVMSVTGGSTDYVYSLDGITFQASATIIDVLSGVHTVYVRDEVTGCIAEKSVTVPSVCPLLTVTGVTTVPSVATVPGPPNGIITIVGASGGSTNYEYSIDGALTVGWQGSNVFPNLPVGTYNAYVRDIDTGCIRITSNVVVALA